VLPRLYNKHNFYVLALTARANTKPKRERERERWEGQMKSRFKEEIKG
jgi:hypothetical protein